MIKDDTQSGHGPGDSFEDFLSRQLQSVHPYLEDDGFAAKVMASLPGNRGLNKRVARLIIGIPMLLISLLVFSRLPWQEAINSVWYLFMAGDPMIMVKAGIFASAVILLSCFGWFARQLRLI